MQRCKRIGAILCICLLLACGGCRIPLFERAVAFDSMKYLAMFQDNWCYRRLNADMQADYGDLYTAVMDGMAVDKTVTVEGETTVQGYGVDVPLSHFLSGEEEVQKLFLAFTNDNPQFFFLERHYGMYGYQQTGTTKYGRITLLFSMNAAGREAAGRQMRETAAAVLQEASQIPSEFERELLLHDWLNARCTYDRRTEDGAPEIYTAYGALTQGAAVCEGYARAMQWLLLQSGMECTLVTGEDGKGEMHMWNLLTIDGENYHLDPTWDDTGDLPRHNYFNLTTEEIALTHRVDRENIGVDTCTATEANYYRRRGRFLDTYSRHAIAQTIAAAVQAGETCIELRFEEGKYDNALLFIQSGNFFFETVNGKLTDGAMWNFDLYGEPAENILMLVKQ